MEVPRLAVVAVKRAIIVLIRCPVQIRCPMLTESFVENVMKPADDPLHWEGIERPGRVHQVDVVTGGQDA